MYIVGLLLLAGLVSVSHCEKTSGGEFEAFEKSLKHVKSTLDSLADQGFQLAEKERMKKGMNMNDRSSNFTSGIPHRCSRGRKFPPTDLLKRLSCFGQGMQMTRNLALERLRIPSGLSQEEALNRIGSLSEGTCLKMASRCGVEDRMTKTPLKRGKCLPFRSWDGTCNNIKHTKWGSSGEKFRRIAPSQYKQPGCQIRTDLPNARDISRTISEANTNAAPDTHLTVMAMQFGQFLDHDITLTEEMPNVKECCKDYLLQANVNDPNCCPIHVDPSDPFYSQFPVECLPFIRSFADTLSCNMNQQTTREQVNSQTAFIDASHIYAFEKSEGKYLKEGTHYMKTSKDHEGKLDGECSINNEKIMYYLPETTENKDFFLAGDPRVNEQPGLISMHTVFIRLHNAIVKILEGKTKIRGIPAWTPSKIFQTARHLVGAVMQSITYREFLPCFFDAKAMKEYDLIIAKSKCSYDGNLDPGLSNEFSTAAYRYGHTMIPSHLGDQLELTFDDPKVMRDPSVSPTVVLKKECHKNAEGVDAAFNDMITNHLFNEGLLYGQDLVVRNIKRGRDHGLPPWNVYRALYNLPAATNLNVDSLTRTGIGAALIKAYNGDLDKVDLFIGLLSEKPDPQYPGNKLGSVASNIILDQFKRLRHADRFWFECFFNREATKAAIRKTTLSEVFCATTCMEKIQDRAMEMPGKGNRERYCKDRNKDPNRVESILRFLKRADLLVADL